MMNLSYVGSLRPQIELHSVAWTTVFLLQIRPSLQQSFLFVDEDNSEKVHRMFLE